MPLNILKIIIIKLNIKKTKIIINYFEHYSHFYQLQGHRTNSHHSHHSPKIFTAHFVFDNL